MTIIESELHAFNRYLTLMVDICNRDAGGYDGVTSPTVPCPNCARRIPSGFPRQLSKSPWFMCPACVRTKRMVAAAERELHGADTDKARAKPTSAELHEMINGAVDAARARPKVTPKTPKSDRLKNLVASLEVRLSKVVDDHERYEVAKLLAVAQKALKMQGES